MPQKLIVAVDFGSTHACARIYDKNLNELAESIQPTGTIDPEACWKVLCDLLDSILKRSGVHSSSIYCLGLSVQRNSFLLWDRQTSTPVTPLCTWQDSAASSFASALNDSQFVKLLNKSGRMLFKMIRTTKFKLISHYKLTCIFSVTRLAHMFAENPGLHDKCRSGEVVFGCLETWLLWRLTDCRAWCTDVSCISATGAFDPCILRLSPIVLNFLKISSTILPPICPTSTFFGEVRCGPLARRPGDDARPVLVTALIGDSQAAMLGEGCLGVGDTKLTLGTGAFVNVNIGSSLMPPNTGFYPVVGWSQSARKDATTSCEVLPDTKHSNVTYLIEGFNSEAGNTLLRLKEAGFFQSYEELETILVDCSKRWSSSAESSPFYVPSSLGLKNSIVKKPWVSCIDPKQSLVFVNTNTSLTEGGIFIGLPATDPSRRPAAVLSQSARSATLFAVMDSIVMAARLLLAKGVNKKFTSKMTMLRVNGNLTKSDWLMQRLADTLNLTVERSAISETCCLGAAIATGVGAGIWETYADAIPHIRRQSAARREMPPVAVVGSSATFKTRFVPDPASTELLDERYNRWTATCSRVLLTHLIHPFEVNGRCCCGGDDGDVVGVGAHQAASSSSSSSCLAPLDLNCLLQLCLK